MDKYKITIIIPVYNAEDYLAGCLESILAQKFRSYEVILVDDGSADSSALICDRYSATDPRFRTIHKENGGVSSARNAGVGLAQGEYLMFVDADDALLPSALETICEGLEGEDFVLGGYSVFMDDMPGREVCPDVSRSYMGDGMTGFFEDNIRKNCEMLDAPWAKLFRRKALNRMKMPFQTGAEDIVGALRFCEDLSYAEDKLFVFGFLASCTSARTCAHPVYAYRLHPGSLGSDVTSDRHLMQLRRFLPRYESSLSALKEKFPSSRKVAALYHKDLVGRYVCRILNIFATRPTALLTEGYLSVLYGLMSADTSLGIFSLRMGQIVNILLFKAGDTDFSVRFYRMISKVLSLRKTKH